METCLLSHIFKHMRHGVFSSNKAMVKMQVFDKLYNLGRIVNSEAMLKCSSTIVSYLIFNADFTKIVKKHV